MGAVTPAYSEKSSYYFYEALLSMLIFLLPKYSQLGLIIDAIINFAM